MLTTTTPYDTPVLERMKKTADDLLKNAEKGEHTQAIVLFSSNEHEYSAVIHNALSEEKGDERALTEKLNAAQDTQLRYVLCMWQNGGIDLPSSAFRGILCDLNPKNADALLFVTTAQGISTRKLVTTMK